MDKRELIPIIEAILFAAGFPVKYDKIAEGEKPYRKLDCSYIPLTAETKDAVIKMYEKFLVHETKRVENYVKRFGKKITINSYWIDR